MKKLTYIHPMSQQITDFAAIMKNDSTTIQELIANIFHWFDENVSYSRLNAPYFPLQRSDLDVLKMKCGTCGDYSNFIVSIFTNLGYKAKYAYLKKDCYGNNQDHICAAIEIDDEYILIDATMPYRKWMGYNCHHMEYELFTPWEFECKLKNEEEYWSQKAEDWGLKRFAGLLYAPWLYEEIIVNTDNVLESVFFLLGIDENQNCKIYVNYFVYTQNIAKTPVMCIIDNDIYSYQFSINKMTDIWDDSQWSKAYKNDEVPPEFHNDYFKKMRRCIDRNLERIMKIIQEAREIV